MPNGENGDGGSDDPEGCLEWLKADPCQLGQLEGDQAHAGDDGELTRAWQAPSLPFCSEQKSASDLGRQQHARQAPVGKRTAAKGRDLCL